MDAELPEYAEVREQDRNRCLLRKEGVVNIKTLPLPVAMREQEISEHDFETLVRIAEDSNAPTGRLKKIPRKIPIRKREVVNN